MQCPECESQQVVKNGKVTTARGSGCAEICVQSLPQAIQRPHWYPDGATAKLLNDCDIGNEYPGVAE